MSSHRLDNRSMFWRVIRRLLTANRGRLFVILLALGSGAAVTAALLNVWVDAQRRLTTEFRTFGPNVIVTPSAAKNSSASSSTLPEDVVQRISSAADATPIPAVPFLVAVADVSTGHGVAIKSVVVGISARSSLQSIAPGWKFEPASAAWDDSSCLAGSSVVSRLQLSLSSTLSLALNGKSADCRVTQIVSTGTTEDDQIFLPLSVAQNLASSPARISFVQVRVDGTPTGIAQTIAALQQRLPEADVHGVRQLTDAESKIYTRISGLLSATVVFVLLLTALCVMAAMTNVAMERKNDVGLMKAIGGATRRVLRLFLAEAAILGIIAGAIGGAVGIALSIWLGKAVFGVAAQPRLIVYPVAVALTIIVAIAGAYPLRRLASIRPASVFRGEA
jgi:putative ABC transport system permease protein